MDENIPNRKLYNDRMARTVVDKIFFLAHIDADVFIDFGCGNGEVLKAISHFNHDSVCIGYDISEEMLKEAKADSPADFIYTDSLETVKELVRKYRAEYKKCCLILSSVIHEVYAYSTEQEIEDFWKFIRETPFDFVAIRDMSYSHTDRKLSKLDIKQLYASQEYYYERKDFEKRWGRLDQGNNALHFLLKYRYRDNWSRELNENYLPISFSKYFQELSNYECLYQHRYTLPYIQQTVFRDFYIELQSPTHCQLIFKRKFNLNE